MLAVATAAPRANACENLTRAELEYHVKAVKRAESALEAGHHVKARRLAREAVLFFEKAKSHVDPRDGRVHPNESGTFDPPDPALRRRATRIDALAASRASKTAAERESAVKRFESEVLGTSPDPTVLADYGEVLSRVPARAAQATTVLRALRDKDLIGSAHAYVALARLTPLPRAPRASDVARWRRRHPVAPTERIVVDQGEAVAPG
jgi:hypothetical protein